MKNAIVMGWYYKAGEEHMFTVDLLIEPQYYEVNAQQYAEANLALVKIFVDGVKVAESDSRPGETNE